MPGTIFNLTSSVSELRFRMLDTLAFGPRAIYDFPARSSREIFYLINVRKGHLEAVEGVSVKYDLSRPNALSTTRSLFRERGECCVVAEFIFRKHCTMHNVLLCITTVCTFILHNALQYVQHCDFVYCCTAVLLYCVFICI